MQAGAGKAGGLTDAMREQLEKAVAISPKQRQEALLITDQDARSK